MTLGQKLKELVRCHKKTYGIGINNAPYIVVTKIDDRAIRCPYHRVWESMMMRAYSEKYHIKRPTYIDVSVCKEWLLFMAFREWMETQDWKGKQLDKDIIVPGNKIYSPKTCCFVSPAINSLLFNNKKHDPNKLLGVDYIGNAPRFKAGIRKHNKSIHLGVFDTPEEAHLVYINTKAEHILLIANEQTDIRIRDGLIRHAELLTQ